MSRHPLLAPAHSDAIAGWLLVLMIIASVTSGVPRIVAGFFAWSAMLLLSYRWGRRQQLQITWLIGLGIAGLTWGCFSGAPLDFGQILAGNQGLVSLLTAVSFLRLGAQGVVANPDRRSLIRRGHQPINRPHFRRWHDLARATG